MTNPAQIAAQAQQVLNAYDEACELLEKGQELSDDQIDAIIGTESEMGNMISALIFMKKTHANRRLIAEKEEEKCMIFVKRIMQRLKVEDRICEDGKAVGKVEYRRDYKDKENKKVPIEYMGPVRGTINSAVQKGIKIEGIEVFEGHLKVAIR